MRVKILKGIKMKILSHQCGGKTSTDQIADTGSASFRVDSEEVNVTVDDNHSDEISQLNVPLQDAIGKEMSTMRVST